MFEAEMLIFISPRVRRERTSHVTSLSCCVFFLRLHAVLGFSVSGLREFIHMLNYDVCLHTLVYLQG